MTVIATRGARTARVLRTTGVGVVAVGLLAGCGFQGARSLPLPGGQGNGRGAMKVTVEFEDVLDLVPASAVKVDDVTVGSVKSIDLDGYTARVVASINKGVQIPANATVSLRQTSLLGEKFVSFDRPPAAQARGLLHGGETIGLDRTKRSAEIEEVLSALSLVLNGGSLEQLQVINSEVVKALQGRESDVKDLLTQLDTFVGGLDDQKGQITRALDSLDRLTGRLATDRATLATALDDVPAGVKVLSQERQQITTVLTSLNQLGAVATNVINASRDNTRASLEALRPILTQLSAAGADLPNSLELLTTYPFPKTIDKGIKGDYANLFITADLDLTQILQAEAGTGPFAGSGTPAPPSLPLSAKAAPAAPVTPAVPAVPTTPLQVPNLQVPALPTDPVVPGLVPAPSGGGGLLDNLRPSSTSGGLLGLLIGGMQ
jgi:phospholipid/cholesterol/gamma-HCH transport system substrate-binding protein